MKYGVRVTFSDNCGSLIVEVHDDQVKAFRRVQQMQQDMKNWPLIIQEVCGALYCNPYSFDVASIGQ